MMKKVLHIIGFLMFSSALFSPALSRTVGAQGSSSGTDESGCSFPWISCNTASRMQVSIPDTDWSATFGTDDPAEAGQDLYKQILGMTRVAPEQKAIKNVTGQFGTTEGNMNRLLNNDFGPILDKNPYLTQDQAIAKMIEIQTRYQEEKELFDLKSDINAAVMPSEIFQNGDTGDSGFDLINDLNNIENILFKKMDPIDVGGAFDASSAGGSGTSGGAGTTGAQTGPTSPISGPPSTGTTSSALTEGEGETTAGEAAGEGPGGTPKSGLGPKPSATENPNICFADAKLDQALEEFASKSQTDPNYKETPTQTKQGEGDLGDGTQPGDGEENIGQTSSALKGPGEFDYNPPVSTGPVKSAPADNWLKAPPCEDILCIQIEFVKKPASAYVDSDNCIACHVEKINEKLKETINHSLIPGKATGNLLEPGICKQATADLFRSVNIRFYAIAKPVLTPTNDDLIYGTNMVDEWEKFVNTYKPFPFYEKKVPDPKDPSQDPFVPTVEDRAAKAAVAYATPDTSIDSANRSVQQAVIGSQKAVSQAVAVAAPAVQTDTDSGFYQSIRRELEQMNFYFQNFQDILHALHEKVGDRDEDHACETLNDLKQCQ